jgi:hypothetical protein
VSDYKSTTAVVDPYLLIDQGEAFYLRGYCHQELKQSEEAEKDFKRAEKLGYTEDEE